MSKNIHIIRKQQVRLKVSRRENSLALQQRFERLVEEQLLPLLEPVFDDLAGPNTWIELDKLDIHLGHLKPGALNSVWLKQIYQAYKKVLEQQIQKPITQKYARKEQMITVLAYFLERGHLPWWVENMDLERAIQEEIPLQAGKIIQLLQSPTARKRWVRQFGEVTQESLFQAILGEDPKKRESDALLLPNNLNHWKAFFPELSTQHLQNIYWEAAWKTLGQAGDFKENWISAVLLQGLHALPEEKALNKLAQLYSQTMLLPKKVNKQLVLVIEKLLPFSLAQWEQVLPAQKARQVYWTAFREAGSSPVAFQQNWVLLLVRQCLLEWPDDTALSKLEHLIQTAVRVDQSVKTLVIKAIRLFSKDDTVIALYKSLRPGRQPVQQLRDQLAKVVDLYLPTPADQKKESAPLPTSRPEEEDIYVILAGTVLIHPFLPAFFQVVDLLEEGQFRNEAARERAVHLLYFLATGLEHPGEQELVLLKLLCGMPLETPIERQLNLSETEKTEATELLNVVIREWDALGEAGPDDLRGTFFVRDGKLKTGDMGWYLRVEVKPFDILLSRLSWGLSPIMHSWMPQMLWVDWG